MIGQGGLPARDAHREGGRFSLFQGCILRGEQQHQRTLGHREGCGFGNCPLANLILHHTIVLVAAHGIVRSNGQRSGIGSVDGASCTGLPCGNQVPLIAQGLHSAGSLHGKGNLLVFQHALIGRGRDDFEQRVGAVDSGILCVRVYHLDLRRPTGKYIEVVVVRRPLGRGALVDGQHVIHIPSDIQPGPVPIAPDDIVGLVFPVGYIGSVDIVRVVSLLAIPLNHYIRIRLGKTNLIACPADENIILTCGINQERAIILLRVALRIVPHYDIVAIGHIGNGAEIRHGLRRPNGKQRNIVCPNRDRITGKIFVPSAIRLSIPLCEIESFALRHLVWKGAHGVLFNEKWIWHIFHCMAACIFLEVYQHHIVVKRELNHDLLALRGVYNRIVRGFFHLARTLVRIVLP